MPRVVLRVDSNFDEQAARAANREAQRYWESRHQQMLAAKLNEAQARKVTGEAKAYYLRQAAEFKVEAKLSQTSARQVVRDAERIGTDAQQAMSSALAAITPAADGAASSLGQVSKAAASIGPAAAVALPVLAAGLADVAGVAAVASQSLWLLPAAAGAVGAAFGTLALGTQGFGDALKDMGDAKKFSEDLRGLAPSAAQAAQSIKSLVNGPIKGLQHATQQALFAGVGEQLNQLASQYLPSIQTMTTGIADSFNQMFKGVANQLMAPETQGALQEFMSNTTNAFRQLAPAIAPLTRALADVMAVGSGVLPDLANAATDAAKSFGEFIHEARQSGDLKRWLDEGIEALRLLGGMVVDAGKAFADLAPIGRQILPDIATGFHAISTVIAPMAEVLQGLTPMVKAFSDSIESVAAAVIPKINQITGAINNLTAPLRAAASLLGMDIAPIAAIQQPDQSVSGNGTPSENRTSRASPSQLPAGTGTAPSASPAPGLGSSAYSNATAPATGPSWGPRGGVFANPGANVPGASAGGSPSSFTAPASAYTGSSHVEDTHGALTPNAAQLQNLIKQLFPAVKDIGGYRSPDGYNEHSSGEALDIMVGGNKALGDQINQFLLQNANALGLQYYIWQQKTWRPDGSVSAMSDRGSPTQNHMDHVHARVKPGPATGFNGGMPSTAQPFASGGGDVQSVYVVNFDQMMTGGGPSAPGGGFGPGGSGAAGGDPLSAFFGGMASQGGPLGPIGVLGGNIVSQATGGGAPGGGGLLGLATNGMGAPVAPGSLGDASNFAGGPGTTPTGFDPAGTGSGGAPDVQGREAGEGGWQPSGGGFQGIGGAPMAAIKGAASSAASAASFGAPGAGQAAEIAIEAANKAAAFGGKAAAIGVQGLSETFLPHGSQSGDPSQNWLGKIASGFAGAKPAGTNTAGKAEVPNKTKEPAKDGSAVDPNTREHGKGKGAAPGPQNGVYIEQMVHQGKPDDGTKIANDINAGVSSYGAGMPW
jgi:hypothetical protein